MIRILNIEPEGYSDEALALLQKSGQVVQGELAREELLAEIGEYDVLITRLRHQIDRQVMDAGRRLKAIVSPTTGLDHIDVDYAADRGIAVLSLRGETGFLRSIHATAEHTWALLLSLQRRMPQAAASVLDGEWERDRYRGRELNGKRLGIVGLGRVGRQVARYGLAFGMDVSAYDPFAPGWVAAVTRASRLAALLSSVDVLTIHVPLEKDTLGMIGRAELFTMPVGSVLVNTARGEIVDTSALIEALESGRLAAAALDVIPDERNRGPIHRSLLEYARRNERLLLTPHIAGATYESMARTEVFMARKLAAYLEALQLEGLHQGSPTRAWRSVST